MTLSRCRPTSGPVESPLGGFFHRKVLKVIATLARSLDLRTAFHKFSHASDRCACCPGSAGTACRAPTWQTAPSRYLRNALVTAGILAVLAPPLWCQTSEGTLNRYIEESLRPGPENTPSAGSLYVSRSFLAELARDPKAARPGDLITIRVVEQASALSSSTVSSSRASDSGHSITNFFGPLNPGGALANLANTSGSTALDGQDSTGRSTSVTTLITSHVTNIMPNGNLIIEGIKEIVVNSERQVIWLRGAVRPVDLAQDNSVTSDRLAMMELRVNGKGVVNDAIRRPNFFIRLLHGIFPF